MIIGGRRVEEAKVFDSEAGFHQFHSEDGEAFGSFEVFWHDASSNDEDDCEEFRSGWYWAAGFPGCLPDGEANGPFGSSSQARADADEFNPD